MLCLIGNLSGLGMWLPYKYIYIYITSNKTSLKEKTTSMKEDEVTKKKYVQETKQKWNYVQKERESIKNRMDSLQAIKMLKQWYTWTKLDQAQKFNVKSKFKLISGPWKVTFHGGLRNSGELYLIQFFFLVGGGVILEILLQGLWLGGRQMRVVILVVVE